MDILCLGLSDNEKEKIYEYIHRYVLLYNKEQNSKKRIISKINQNNLTIIDFYECLELNKIENCIVIEVGEYEYKTYQIKKIEKYLISYPKRNKSTYRNLDGPIRPKFIIQRIT